jgi:glucose-1-phosphate thymidylyltransferase
LIISTPEDLPGFERLLGDGSTLGLTFSYAEQPSPDGLAQAFIIGKEFIGDGSVCLVLGDNIFYGHGFERLVKQAKQNVESDGNATVFGYYVNDPERYGVAEFDGYGKVLSIEEKPKNPKSNYAVVGLYFYPNSVVEIAENIKPSTRGELEITSVNEEYLNRSELMVNVMGRGYAWLDTGTHDSLAEAGEFFKALEKRQGLKIGCIEKNCLEKGSNTKPEAIKLGKELSKTDYGQYLVKIAKQWK